MWFLYHKHQFLISEYFFVAADYFSKCCCTLILRKLRSMHNYLTNKNQSNQAACKIITKTKCSKIVNKVPVKVQVKLILYIVKLKDHFLICQLRQNTKTTIKHNKENIYIYINSISIKHNNKLHNWEYCSYVSREHEQNTCYLV